MAISTRDVQAESLWHIAGLSFNQRQWARGLSLLRRNKTVAVSGAMVLLFVASGLVGPFLTPYSYAEQDMQHVFAPPSTGHLLGTDQLGRDLLTRTVYGVRISLLISGIVSLLSLTIGMVVGLAAGYYRGRLDYVLSSLMDMAWAFPIMLVAIICVTVIGPGIPAILIGVSIVNWSGFGRIIRGEVLVLREKEFIEGARAVGVSDRRIFLRYLIPNVFPATMVMASFYMGIVIIAEAGLSFVGLGAQPPLPSLGQIIAESRDYMFLDIWLTIMPSMVLAVGVLGFNLLGDSLRDMLDPRLRL